MPRKLPAPVNNEKLLALARQLVPDDETCLEDVRLAVEDPKGYVARFRSRLEERTIKGPEPDMPWIALVDALEARHLLVEVDCREAAEEIVDLIEPLVERYGLEPDHWDWIDEDDWTEADAASFLQEANRRFASHGVVLGYIDISSESCPLIALRPDQFARAQELARGAGYGRIVRFGDECLRLDAG